jgi:hypothetical protein
LAINPPSDIVLDVARAADPLKLQAAALKLTGATDAGENAGFSSMVEGLEVSGGHSGPAAISTPGLIGLQSNFGPKGPQLDRAAPLSGPAMKPYRDFEAFVLQSFVQSMLPNEAEDVFGRGTAGAMWKGLLAEQLGKQLARSGGIGIAAAVLKAHPGGMQGRGLTANATHGDLGAQMAALSPHDAALAAASGTTSKRTP